MSAAYLLRLKFDSKIDPPNMSDERKAEVLDYYHGVWLEENSPHKSITKRTLIECITGLIELVLNKLGIK